MKRVALHNLGCKVNSYEIDVMQQKLADRGYEIVPFDQIADVYIVNTCTVTNIADRKSRQMLHRAKQKNPQAVVVAVGCYVQTGKEQLALDESVDLAIGNNRKSEIVEILEQYLEEKSKEYSASIPDIDHTYEYEEMQLTRTAEHTRAYIKIQDGCNQFCSYCAIPLARGRVRSRRPENVLAEVRGIVAKGYKEIVLTGIHLSSYGIDFDEEEWKQGNCVTLTRGDLPAYSGKSKLIDLVEQLQQIEGLERIRLGSLEPRVVTRENAFRLAALSKLCPHFHLSLQSGSDATLRRMNRHYTAQEYLDSVNCLREAFRQPAITTDVIVGFPGETEEEFAETKDFLEKVQFYELHVFKYSKRAGTVAAGMKNQVPEQVKTVRSNELLAMDREISRAFREKHIGLETEVLFEEELELDGANYYVGHTRDYIRVAVPAGEENLCGTIQTVKISGFFTEDMMR
ncbi:MAG: MiaB/RimO family radical SAM methylthiotransferase [Acetatifactor sp.]